MSVIELGNRKLDEAKRGMKYGLPGFGRSNIEWWTGYIEGAEDQRREDEQPASQWHRVEEELPRGQELVIVAVKDTAGDTPFWYTQCGWITTDGEYWIVDNDICDYVVAWMPLPEPPQEEV